jgi:glycosyltransferase involved in cell wall biosynthesis
MKVIYVTSSFPFGSGEAFIMPELTELQAQGHQVKVVPLLPRGKIIQGDGERFLTVSSVVPLCSIRIVRDFMKYFCKQPGVMWTLICSFSRGTFAMSAKNCAVLPKAAWLAHLARGWGADHIHAFWASAPASLALATSELSGIPWSFSAHRFDIIENNLMRLKAERAQFVRFISADGRRLSGLEGTPLESKTVVLHLGIDADVAPATSATTSVPIILCVSALIPRKGHSVLLRAMQELESRGVTSELWLAGDGDLRKALRQEVRARGLEKRVKFLGTLPHSQLMSLYANGRVTMGALASYHEGIPVSLMEAMAFGVPVIATQAGGIPELLSNGAGLMISPDDWHGMADAMYSLIDNMKLRESLGSAARERVQSSFAASQVATRMAALLGRGLLPTDIQTA